VLSEVALGVALLIVTGLLVRTFANLNALEPGFDASNLVTASVSLQDARYQDADVVNRLVDESLRRLRDMPAVESAAVSLQSPYTRLLNWGFRFSDASADAGAMANVVYVSDGFFETLGIPVRSGRAIDRTDRSDSRSVVVVSSRFEQAFADGRPMIGRRVGLANAEREIVGVVGDVQQADSGIDFAGRVEGPLMTTPTIYLPVSQAPAAMLNAVHTWFRPVWTVRARAEGQAGNAVASAIADVDPLLPIGSESTVEAVVAESTAVQRLMMMLVGVLAGAALLLAAIGIQGLIAQSVNERAREFAIRLALGASMGATVGRLAMSGLALAGGGAVLGVAIALWAAQLVRGFLWGVGEHDALTYLAVIAFFLVVAAAASVLPALGILRLDPAETLIN
jgi:putative ABC transport system permease protein